MESTCESTSEERLRALWSCNAFIGRTHGLLPNMTLWLYKRMIIHKTMYAAVVWWDLIYIASARSELSELELLQSAACTMITEAMRTTPTKVLKMLLVLPTLRTVVESTVLKASYHLPWPDSRNKGVRHNWICKSR